MLMGVSLISALLVLAGCSSDSQRNEAITPTSPPAVSTPAVTPTVRVTTPTAPPATPTVPLASFKDATYVIEGRPTKLTNGLSVVEAAPGSASRLETSYWGNEASGDLNGDGLPDVAFLLTLKTGGTGTFYYVVVGLRTGAGYTGTNAVGLGDRIAPQTTEIRGGELIVNYADRRPGEPMIAQPTVGMTKRLAIVNGDLVER